MGLQRVGHDWVSDFHFTFQKGRSAWKKIFACLNCTAVVGFPVQNLPPRVIIIPVALAVPSHLPGNTSLVLLWTSPCVCSSLPVSRPPPLSRPDLSSRLFTHAHTHTRKLLPGFVVSGFSPKNQDLHPQQQHLSRSPLYMTHHSYFNNHLQGSFCSKDNSQSLSRAFRLAAISLPSLSPVIVPFRILWCGWSFNAAQTSEAMPSSVSLPRPVLQPAVPSSLLSASLSAWQPLEVPQPLGCDFNRTQLWRSLPSLKSPRELQSGTMVVCPTSSASVLFIVNWV